MIADPKTETAARVQAFLNVELYKAVFEKYRRFSLPGKTGLEGARCNRSVCHPNKQIKRDKPSYVRRNRLASSLMEKIA